MKLRTLLLLFLSAVITLQTAGCKDDDDDASTGDVYGIPIGPSQCRDQWYCAGVAECVNSFCECPEGVTELARGFCIQNENRSNWVTYDQVDGLIDTMVLALDEEPFDNVWAVGDDVLRFGDGAVYNRNTRVRGIGGGSGTVIYYHWPGDFVTPVDSVWIFHTFDKGNDYQSFRTGGWLCAKVFKGAFIDRNTLRGQIFLGNCYRYRGNGAQPEVTMRRHPVTFRRLE